ncbi:MAG: multicopper oxidase domain-containing protein [Nitrosomonadaceae bacterium]
MNIGIIVAAIIGLALFAIMLVGSVFTPIQLVIDGVSNFEIQKERPEVDVMNTDLIVLPAEHEPVHLHFITPDALRLIPEAEAMHITPDKTFVLIADEDEGQTVLPTGDPIHFMSFNGVYPAPTLRMTEGDVIQITIINEGDEIHSIDHHGSQISAVPNFGDVVPDSSKTFTFVAANAGVFVYHCEGENVFGLDKHALTGMEGMLIIDPKNGYKRFSTDVIENIQGVVDENVNSKVKLFRGPAREFALVYSEWYLTDAIVNTPSGSHGGGNHNERLYDKNKMFSNDPSYTHVNGIPFGYVGPLLAVPPWTGELNPVLGTSASSKVLSDVLPILPGNPDPPLIALLDGDGDGESGESTGLVSEVLEDLTTPGAAVTHLDVEKGEQVRFFIQNGGNRHVAWHIVGEQLDRVSVGKNTMTYHPIQTWDIAPFADATIDVVFEQPGIFAAVNHDYSGLFKGQATIIVVHDPDVTSCDALNGFDLVFCLITSGPAKQNPANAIPPLSDLPDTSIDQTSIACAYGIGALAEDEFGSECSVI